MTIKNVRVSLLRAPLNQPFRIATGRHDVLENALLALTLSDGTKGFGEAAVATHITGETVPQTVKSLNTMGEYLRGRDVGDYLTMCAHAQEALSDNKSAAAAVEMALFDAVTKYLNIPLWRLWGPRARPFATDITIVIGSLEETAAKTKEFYRRGFRAFKVKIGRDMDVDFKRVQTVSAIAPKSTLVLDANQGYSARETLQFLKALAKAGIEIALIEQPVPKADWDGLKKVTRSCKTLVCADESVGSLSQAARAIKEKAVGAINIKLMKTGIVHAVAIAHLARANGVKLMIGGMMESALAMTASAHLAAGLGCFDFIDLDTPFFIKDGLRGHPCLDARGIYNVGKVKAGIGISP
ncbi:MAG: dipeptide epimerase [Candidatus Omnitrophica bacterium]|nr:dipeptide epimerase [Candidatus Omnitrophota bacterium]